MAKDLVIFGTGGFAREVHQVVEDLNKDSTQWNFRGFLDDNRDKYGSEVHGFPVLGGGDWLARHPEVHIVVGVGSPKARESIVNRIREVVPNPLFATLIHPLAWVGNRVEIGEGSIICAGNLVTTDIKIYRHVILNIDCTVGHDSILRDFVTVNPSVNISGNVTIGRGAELGTGGAVIQGVTIGEETIVGAGAVVVRDLPSRVTAVGVPAKVIKEHS
ncbi:MAG: acetyltransferase [Deinococcota bacterium]